MISPTDSAYGNWLSSPYLNPFSFARSSESMRKPKKNHSKKQRKHHYAFDVDDNGLDINGFILHTDKHKGKRHKFRVYQDSNENERFDKNDQLIGRVGIRSKHAAKGVGNLLDEAEVGLLEIKFNRDKSNASKRADPQLADITDGLSQTLNLSSLDFNDADGSHIVSVTPAPGAAWEQLH